MTDEFYDVVGSEVKPTYHFYWGGNLRRIMLDGQMVWGGNMIVHGVGIQPKNVLADPVVKRICQEVIDGKAHRIDHSDFENGRIINSL